MNSNTRTLHIARLTSLFEFSLWAWMVPALTLITALVSLCFAVTPKVSPCKCGDRAKNSTPSQPLSSPNFLVWILYLSMDGADLYTDKHPCFSLFEPTQHFSLNSLFFSEHGSIGLDADNGPCFSLFCSGAERQSFPSEQRHREGASVVEDASDRHMHLPRPNVPPVCASCAFHLLALRPGELIYLLKYLCGTLKSCSILYATVRCTFLMLMSLQCVRHVLFTFWPYDQVSAWTLSLKPKVPLNYQVRTPAVSSKQQYTVLSSCWRLSIRASCSLHLLALRPGAYPSVPLNLKVNSPAVSCIQPTVPCSFLVTCAIHLNWRCDQFSTHVVCVSTT